MSGNKEEQLESLVFQYLKQKGFKELSRSDGKAVSLEEQAFEQLVSSEAVQHSLLKFAVYDEKDTTPEKYSSSYTQLREWVHSSLDMYKNELCNVLFPVFVHCFLDMVKRGWAREANEFLLAHEKEHQELYSQELIQLKGKTKENLEEGSFVNIFLEKKTEVLMCSYSFELLMGFVQKSGLLLILGIINQRIDIKITGVHPSDEVPEQTALGFTRKEKDNVNMKKVHWGQIPEQVWYEKRAFLDEVEAKEEAHKEIEEAAKAKGEEPPPFKKPRWHDPQMANIDREKRLPLRDLDADAEDEMVEDVKFRIQLSATELPSIAIYTFLNTHASLNNVEISKDGSVVAGCFADSQIKVWNLNELAESQAGGQVLPHHLLVGHSGAVYSSSFSSDKKYMVSASADSTVRLWDMEKKKALVVYKGHNYPVWDVNFSPLGYYFVSCSHDRTARLWTTDRISPVRMFAGHLADVDTCQFHPNCNYVGTGSTDKSVRLWDVNSGECMRLFTGHSGPVYSLAFSPDGRYLASAGEDKQVMIWDIASGKRIRTLQGHQKTVWSMDFSMEGTILATGSADNTVRLWGMHGLDEPDKNPRNHTISSELIKTFPTKATPGMHVKFTRRNLLLAGGPFAA